MALTEPTIKAANDRLTHRLSQMPMFHKVLAANSAIVLLGAVVGTFVIWNAARQTDLSAPELLAP
ncbi:MAG: hypothetical protein KGJ86_17280, partial [Chloroflexota bacterium]|nr:hypothetical protein [Chloroflexota bacterium]